MRSNRFRFQELFSRAAAGEHITVGFIGGSITQGSLSSSPKTCYAYLVYRWFRETFPNADISYVNAGIGGTDSLFGAARVWEDLLMHAPDFVCVDFSVNDKPDPYYEKTYLGLITRIFTEEPLPAMLALGNIYYDTGVSADRFHKPICDMYDIPYINMRDSMYQDIIHGKMKREEISPDGLHPNDRGHAGIAAEITECLEGLAKSESTAEAFCADKELPELRKEDARFLSVTRHWIENCRPKLLGFRVDAKERMGKLDLWSNGWIASEPFSAIEFTVEGSEIAVQYRKRPKHLMNGTGAPAALCFLDDREPVILDGNFEEDWGDCLYLQPVLVNGTPGSHHIRIVLMAENEAKAEKQKQSDSAEDVFYLNAVITAGN